MRLNPGGILDVHPEDARDDEPRQSGGAEKSQGLGGLSVAVSDARHIEIKGAGQPVTVGGDAVQDNCQIVVDVAQKGGQFLVDQRAGNVPQLNDNVARPVQDTPQFEQCATGFTDVLEHEWAEARVSLHLPTRSMFVLPTAPRWDIRFGESCPSCDQRTFSSQLPTSPLAARRGFQQRHLGAMNRQQKVANNE